MNKEKKVFNVRKTVVLIAVCFSSLFNAQEMQKKTSRAAVLNVIQRLVDKAFEDDNAKSLASLLHRYSVDLDTKDLLDRAIRSDKANIIDFLVNRIRDPDREIIALRYTLNTLATQGTKDRYLNSVRPKNGLTPLLQAIKDKKIKKINFLLSMGANPNYTSADNISPLIAASFFRLPEVVKELLDTYHVPIDAQNANNMSALMTAAKAGYPEVVTVLLERDASTKPTNNRGYTALFLAAQKGHANIVEMLLKRDPASVDIKSNDGTSPLMIAAHNGHDTVVNILLDYGAHIDDTNKVFATALLLAISNNKPTTVLLLLNRGANIELANQKDGLTPLVLAAILGYIEIVKILINHNAKLNTQDHSGYSALMHASKNGHLETVNALLERGASTRQGADDGKTALFLAIEKEFPLIVRSLLQSDPKLVHIKDSEESTPLISAVESGNYEVVQALLDHSKENINKPNGDLMAPLAIAVSEMENDFATDSETYFNIVKLLLKEGANTETTNTAGSTPLISAAIFGYTDAVKALIDHNANLNAKDNDENTPLIYAAKKGHLETVKSLLAAGADSTLKNKKNQTALSLATAERNTHIVRLLRDALSKLQAKTIKKKKKKKKKKKPALHCPAKVAKVPVHTAATAIQLQSPIVKHSPPTVAPEVQEKQQEQKEKQKKANNTIALWESVTTGIPKEITVSLGKPFNPNHVNEHGDTLLMHAIKKAIVDPATRRHEVFLTLLNNPAIVETINQQNHKNETTLMLGITDVSITQQLLTSGARPDITDERDNTIIIRAVQKDGTSLKNILHLLKEQVSNDQYTALLNKQNQDGMSALMYAIQKNDPDNVELLLSHGANFNSINNQGLTPLELAHQVRALVTSAEEPEKEQIARAEEVTQILQQATQPETAPPIATPATPQKQIALGDDPLFDELAKGSRAKVTTIEAIISEKPRDLLRQRAGGTTPLMVAIESNVTEKVLRSLLEKLSQEHIQLVEAKSGETALHKAIKNSRVGFVQLLLEQKVPFVKHDIGLARALLATAKKAKQKGKTKRLKTIINLLEKAYTQQEQGNQLLVAAFAGDLTKVDTALGAGASINTQDEDGNTPLMQAIKANKDTTARHLIEQEARLNIQNNQGSTALMLATKLNNYGLIDYLLRHGADDRIEDNTGQTAYGYAIEHGYTNITNRISINRALQNIQRSSNISHVLQRHFDPRGDKITELVGPEDQDVYTNPYTGRLADGTTASFFPRSWNSNTIYNAIVTLLEKPEALEEKPATINADGEVVRNALIVKGTYQDIPVKIIISEAPQVGWILFTAYPDIKK